MKILGINEIAVAARQRLRKINGVHADVLIALVVNLDSLFIASSARKSEAEASPPKKSKNSEDPCGSIRDITSHSIHHKNTSIAETCIVFNKECAGNDPRWIYWNYEFYFFDPGDFRPGGQHRLDPEVKIGRSKGLNPSFYVVFHVDFEKQN